MWDLTFYQWLCLLGVPGLCAGLTGVCVKSMTMMLKKIGGVTMGTQALLRAQMIADYNKWSEAGYAPIYARENFENCWVQYHMLGANGVMDDIHEKFKALPTLKEG